MISENDNIRTNSTAAWVLAARPKTLAGAAVPVMIGVAMALRDTVSASTVGMSGGMLGGLEDFQVLPAMLCLLFAFLMQIDSNFINDYFDCVKGNDNPETRLGPKRACSEGWVTMAAMRRALVATSSLACIVGLPLIAYGGWEMVVVGAACVAFAFLYTTFFSYLGLGDVLVLVFFGIVPVCFTYYVVMPAPLQTIPTDVITASTGCGMIIDTLLCINNFRDRHVDRQDHKRTLIVRLGEKRGAALYNTVGIAGAAVTFLSLVDIARPLSFITIIPFLLYLYKHSQSYGEMKRIWNGRELNKVLGMTARDMLIYGLMTVVATFIQLGIRS